MKRKTSPLTGAIVLLVIIAVYTGVFNRGDKTPPSVADKQGIRSGSRLRVRDKTLPSVADKEGIRSGRRHRMRDRTLPSVADKQGIRSARRHRVRDKTLPSVADKQGNPSSTATAQASAEKAATQPKARAPKQRATKLPGYEVVLDDSSDTPIKTQVELRVTLDKRPSESELQALLRSLYEKAKKRSGFKFRAHPSAVYIYAFAKKNYHKNSGASWIGMLSYYPDEEEPTISVNSYRLKAQFEEQRKQTTHRGLSVEQRKQKIYWELFEITDKAQRDADRKVPNPKTLEDFERQGAEWNKRHALYLKRLLLKYRITDKQRVQITVEGMQKNWPAPSP